MPSSVSTYYPFLSVVSLYGVVALIFFGKNIFQVTWMSYESPEMMVLQESHGLNSMCFRDKMLWTAQCPLIFDYTVEYHLPSRVIRQFGLEQPICLSTLVELHGYVHKCMIYMYYSSYL
jgi:hypothetical protein